jgi:hypothetical protein
VISDALSAAVNEIDRCLRVCPECYSEPVGLRGRIEALRESMDNLRNDIDCGPAQMQEAMARTAGK